VVKNENGDVLDGFCLPKPNVTGSFVFCGFGSPSEFPASVRGKIALISRGNNVKFVDKAKNAKAAGAIGVIVYDNLDEPLLTSAFGNFTSASTVPEFLPYVFISQADGLALKATADATVTLGWGFESYALESGTSMATPHATGVAALVWAAAPTASASDITNAVINNAKDLGDAGVDSVYGHGVVNALDAAKQLNPAAFGSGGTPPSAPRTGRVPGRRG
jgi:subtilisin family serine protease